MPLPKPKKDESHDDFISRCMGDDVMLTEYPDDDQRYAVCETQWESKDNKATIDESVERRIMSPEDIEMRIEGEGDETRLIGYAAKFNKLSVDMGFWEPCYEKIAPGAFTDAIKDGDTRALKNHDPNLILGRSTSGTLQLTENKIGLKFNIDIPNTTTGKDTLEEVRRGDITGCSFAFTVASETWENQEDGSILRTINKVDKLFDVGPVTYPAYPDTTVAARSLSAYLDGKEKEKKEKEAVEQKAKTKVSDFEREHKINVDYRYAGRVLRRFEEKYGKPYRSADD
jgi:HK97 family phage prohead protease